MSKVKKRAGNRVTHTDGRVGVITQSGPMQDYEVCCPQCSKEFTVSVYPEFCVMCAGKLEDDT